MDELEKEVGTYTFQKLHGPERDQRCMEKAKIWLESKFSFCHRPIKDINYQDAAITEIILKRAAYELYSMAEQEIIAQDKKEDALELLAGILGPQVFQSSFSDPPTPSPVLKQAGAVKQKTKTRWDNYG